MELVRSTTEFSRQPVFRETVKKLASAENLVLYCGAGVTIDFTGLDWGALNSKLFEGLIAGLPREEEAKRLLGVLGPIGLSSILEEAYARAKNGDAAVGRKVRHDRMRDLLYRTDHWQTGRLADSICRLSVAFLRRGRSVTILTTNQDTFLEITFKKYIDEAIADGHALNLPPEPHITVLGEEPAQASEPASTNQLKVVYLHGRIPDHGEGEVQGFVPNGEVDFSTRHEIVRDEILRHLRDQEGAFVAVGTSLRDQPIIEALALDRDGTMDKSCLIPVPFGELSIDTAEAQERLLTFLQFRASHLGFTFVFPDFYSQYPQFFQEVVSELNHPGGLSHGGRLDLWEKTWREGKFASDPSHAHASTADLLAAVRAELNGAKSSYAAPAEERFRLEVWRRDPGKRRLVLHAQSSGEIRDPDVARFAEIAHYSGNCSVDSFIAGRPLLKRADDYERSRKDQRPWNPRWKHYLSVPIAIPYKNGVVSVGVLTLTTMSEDSTLTLVRDGFPHILLSICTKMRSYGAQFLGIDEDTAVTTPADSVSLETQAIDIVTSFGIGSSTDR
ncbi:hypothetical protein [Microbacterium ureisolvens]|uniref:SIR2-like domain-containing protein n=1 Tax=Microbacterium ureisolvens TaxID=2781186 RepID=A0ABS7HY42_9MICO|nr:hypothetical protein [Microbacterium ureisolvens]MBW9110168.1 hypothetical protein [Microbacterium ureisolvens]